MQVFYGLAASYIVGTHYVRLYPSESANETLSLQVSVWKRVEHLAPPLCFDASHVSHATH